MPAIKIECARKWSQNEKEKLVDIVHGALVETLKIPAHDKLVRVIDYDEENFVVPAGRSHNFVFIQVDLFLGRTLEAKRMLYKKIVKDLAQLGIDEFDIRILLNEQHKDNWGIRGGQAASDVFLEYKVDV